MEKDPRCTVLVTSCDKYLDLLEPFTVLFQKYWGECPFEKVLVTETHPDALAHCFDRVIVCGGGKNWASRLVEAIDQITTPYVLMLCDDYYLEAPVDTAQLLRRLDDAQRLGAVNLRLIPNPRQGEMRSDGLMEYPKNTAYCVSTLTGIWEKEFLRRLAEPVGSIWEFERRGSFSVSDERRPILATVRREFPFVDAAHKGHWEPFGVRVCRDNGIALDFSRRGLPSGWTRFKEGCKALIFALVPNTLLVRLQNALDLGAHEKHEA